MLRIDADGDFFFFERNAPDDVVQTIKQLVQKRLVGQFGISDPREIQVLTPMNRGPLGTHRSISELQDLLNPRGRELRAGDRRLPRGRSRHSASQQLRQAGVQWRDRARVDD